MRKGIKKFLIAFLALVCFACLGVAAACQTEAEYFTLTYVTEDCVTVESEAKNGARIKNGTQISFTLTVDENAEGEPAVSINGSEVRPDSNGVYTFKMTRDTTVTVTGVYFMNVYKVEFDKSYTVTDDDNNKITYYNDFIEFLDTDGNAIEMADVTTGESISFKLHVSVYYGKSPEYTVLAGTSVVTPDENGVYTFSVTGDTKVTVTGLPTDLGGNSFLAREDGGEGTEDKPFLIREPVDLYAMADRIEEEFYQTENAFYQTAFYKLANDIDLEGERLYVIGNTLTQLSAFAGVFDGNGKTIKNYTMTNTVIEQSGFGKVYLPNVGLFGFAPMAAIYNLNLENFTINIEGTGVDNEDNMCVGALVGYARGTDIQNCSASGRIVMQGGSEKTSFVGGLVGVVASFSSEDEAYPASIESCSTDVEVSVLSGFIYGAGGIVGLLSADEERNTAYVLNCYATGDLYGAMRAGGVVGLLGPYTSVKNCYATGLIEADNDLAETTGNEDFSYAYAGGIAAYAEYGSVVSNCFFTGKTVAYATENKYAVTDGVVAGVEGDGVTYVYTDGAVVFNCYTTDKTSLDGAEKVSSVTSDIIINTEKLGWSDKDWKFPTNGLPQINRDVAEKVYTVTVKIDGKTVHEWEVNSYYASMGHWYAFNAASLEDGDPTQGIPEFIGNDGMRTYGYFFDEELTKKVPFGYIPTDDMTVYAGYANYGSVAGVYYLQGLDGILELTLDGAIFYRNGALSVISTYVYNGDYIVLYNTFLAILVDSEVYDFYTFKANVEGGVMSIYDNEIFPERAPLIATQKLEGFRYGTYYSAQNTEYTFNENGLGVEKQANGAVTNFSFTLSKTASGYGAEIIYGLNGASIECEVNSDGVVTSFNGNSLTVYDIFKGVWESEAGVNRQYSFDGNGNWTYKHYDYDKEGKEVIISSDSGTYTLSGEAATLDGTDIQVKFKDKFLSVGDETFYKENSFAGVWSFAGRSDRNEPIELTLKGIGTDGYGIAEVNYLIYGKEEVNYSVIVDNGNVYITLYIYYNEWGLLKLDKANNTLTGDFYSEMQEKIISNVTFCLYDDLKGTWNAEGGGDITSLKFNGLGRYDITGSVNCIATSGQVNVNGGRALKYTLDVGGLTGSFKYNDETYTFSYDRNEDILTVTCGEERYTLTRAN